MKTPSLRFLTLQNLRNTVRRYKTPLAIMLVLTGAFSNIGTRLGLWSTSTKSGLLPYEAPTFQAFREIFISDAFAS